MTVDLESLRASLLSAPVAGQSFFEEEDVEGILIPAAVLFPIVAHDSGYTVLLTQRTAHLKDHAGQISFPGGRVEVSDLSPVDTALRETEEEIGLSRERAEVLGFLPEYRTSTGFCVTPVVALIHPPFDLHPDPFEVAEIFEVPLGFLLDPANHQRHSLHYRGALRSFFAMPYGDYFIWGATAGMIRSLSQRLGLLQGAGAYGMVAP